MQLGIIQVPGSWEDLYRGENVQEEPIERGWVMQLKIGVGKDEP